MNRAMENVHYSIVRTTLVLMMIRSQIRNPPIESATGLNAQSLNACPGAQRKLVGKFLAISSIAQTTGVWIHPTTAKNLIVRNSSVSMIRRMENVHYFIVRTTRVMMMMEMMMTNVIFLTWWILGALERKIIFPQAANAQHIT